MARMRTALNNAAFGTGDTASELELKSLVEPGRVLLSRAEALAASS